MLVACVFGSGFLPNPTLELWCNDPNGTWYLRAKAKEQLESTIGIQNEIITPKCKRSLPGSSTIVWKQPERIISAGERLIRKDRRMRLVKEKKGGIGLQIAKVTPEDRGAYDHILSLPSSPHKFYLWCDYHLVEMLSQIKCLPCRRVHLRGRDVWRAHQPAQPARGFRSVLVPRLLSQSNMMLP